MFFTKIGTFLKPVDYRHTITFGYYVFSLGHGTQECAKMHGNLDLVPYDGCISEEQQVDYLRYHF